MAEYKHIIQLGEHIIQLPYKLPKSKEEILFIDQKKDDAYWKRLEFPKIFYDFVPYDIPRGRKKTQINRSATIYNDNDELISLSEEDTKEMHRLLRLDIKRRTKGVFMKIYDEIIWVPPGYYNTLQWVMMKDYKDPETGTSYGRFRDIQNQFFIIWEYVKHHPYHIGLNVAKCKKSGITQVMAGDFLNDATLNEGWEMGVFSKEYDHAVDVAMAYFFHGLDNMPLILRPEETNRNQHEVNFGKPRHKVKGKENYLNTHVFAAKTKPTCLDGPVIRRGWGDEFPKTWESSHVSPDSIYKKTLETVRLQQKKNGALIYTSYMPEIDDRGFLEFRSLWERSKLSTLSQRTGTTETMFINFPITAVQSNELSFDKFGRCDELDACQRILEERATKRTTSDKQAHKRTNPIDENDMFDSGGRGSAFDNIRLGMQLKDLREKAQAGVRDYREGHLRWKNSIWEEGHRPKHQFCEVYFEELTEDQLANGEKGSILFFHDLQEDMLNLPIKNNLREHDGFLCPGKTLAVGGFDPTDYKLKRDVAEGSTNGCYGGLLDDSTLDSRYGKKITDVPLFEYLWRWNDPDKTEEDLYKLMIYLNMLFLIEANKGWLITSAKLAGLHHFLLLMQKDGSIKPYQEGDENGLVNTTRDMVTIYCRAIAKFIAAPRNDSDIDLLKLIRAIRLIQQLMDFDPTNPKKYDAVVSFGYFRVAVESYTLFLMSTPEFDDGGGMEAAIEGLLDF